MSEDPTSLSLLQKIREDRGDAWTRFVRIYEPLIQGWSRRFGVTGADAEDLCQEVLQTVRRGIGAFERDGAGRRFRKWLYTIVRTKAVDQFRRRSQQPEAAGGSLAGELFRQLPEAEPADWNGGSLSEHAVFRRALECVRAEFEPRTWQAFWRTRVDEEPTADVAADLSMSPSAVRKARFRVTHRLRDELAGLMDDLFDRTPQ